MISVVTFLPSRGLVVRAMSAVIATSVLLGACATTAAAPDIAGIADEPGTHHLIWYTTPSGVEAAWLVAASDNQFRIVARRPGAIVSDGDAVWWITREEGSWERNSCNDPDIALGNLITMECEPEEGSDVPVDSNGYIPGCAEKFSPDTSEWREGHVAYGIIGVAQEGEADVERPLAVELLGSIDRFVSYRAAPSAEGDCFFGHDGPTSSTHVLQAGGRSGSWISPWETRIDFTGTPEERLQQNTLLLNQMDSGTGGQDGCREVMAEDTPWVDAFTVQFQAGEIVFGWDLIHWNDGSMYAGCSARLPFSRTPKPGEPGAPPAAVLAALRGVASDGPVGWSTWQPTPAGKARLVEVFKHGWPPAR